MLEIKGQTDATDNITTQRSQVVTTTLLFEDLTLCQPFRHKINFKISCWPSFRG